MNVLWKCPALWLGHFHFKESSGVGMVHLGYLPGGSFCNYFPSFVASFGADVYDPVAVFDDVEVVFDDDDTVAFVNEFTEDFEEVLNVLEVQAGGWFVENVEGVAGLYFGELGG